MKSLCILMLGVYKLGLLIVYTNFRFKVLQLQMADTRKQNLRIDNSRHRNTLEKSSRQKCTPIEAMHKLKKIGSDIPRNYQITFYKRLQSR